jgi:hypothetical protein
LGISAVPAAELIIDDFASPAGGQSIALNNFPAGSSGFSFSPSATVLGGWRLVGVDIESVLSGSNSIKAAVNVADTPPNYQLEQSIRVNGFGTLKYDANGAGLNVNLTSFSGIRLVAAENDLLTVYTLKLESFAGGSSSLSQSISSGAGDLDFSFASLVGTANLADIDRITLTINPDRAGDVYLERIVTIITPLPASLVLFGTGLLSLLGVRRWL